MRCCPKTFHGCSPFVSCRIDLPFETPLLLPIDIIIYRYSWVADGLNGQILDKNGNIKRKVPEFSELFPEDWELPVSPAKDVDLSYYAISDE